MQSPYPFKAPHKLAMLGHSKPPEASMFGTALRQMSFRRTILAALVLIVLMLGYFPNSYQTALSKIQTIRPGSIPRIVHLVQLRPNDDAELHFSFQSFLCVYSAYHYIQPTQILIHTDYNQSAINHAIAHGSSWTRKVLTAFPKTVKLHQVVAPTEAANGLALVHIEHKSDFVRMEQVGLHGGLYLDWDVLTLRSPTPLLDAGFAAVVGRQVDGNINNGLFLATKDAALVRLMNQEMGVQFSGEWQRHSTGLITPIAERIAFTPGEVLIMDQKAFAPTSWMEDSASALFSESEEGDEEEVSVVLDKHVNDVDTLDPMDRWNNRIEGRDGEMDFSQTYFLHAFKSMWGRPVPRFDGVNVPYILRRRANYALAAWPVVMQGIKDGIIEEKDESF